MWLFSDATMASIFWSRLEENIEIFVEKIVRFESDCLQSCGDSVNIAKMLKYFELISLLEQTVSYHSYPSVSFDPSVTIENFFHIPCLLPKLRFFDKETTRKVLFPNGYRFENINHSHLVSKLLFIMEQLRRDLNFVFSISCCRDIPTGPEDLPPLNFLTENSALNHSLTQFPADFLLHARDDDGRLIVPFNLLD